MKKHHNDEMMRTIREKDEEIVRSNKDILQSYSDLKDEYEAAKIQHSKFRLLFEEQRVELIFVKNKEEQTLKLLKEREEEMSKTKEENDRYRKYLR